MQPRHRAREIAVQALYSWEINPTTREQLLSLDWITQADATSADLDFARLLVGGTLEEQDHIDALLRKHLQNWDLDRIALVERSILRLAVYSLLFHRDIPPQVTIDEAVELAKAFASDESYRLVNGVLDAINTTLTAERGINE